MNRRKLNKVEMYIISWRVGAVSWSASDSVRSVTARSQVPPFLAMQTCDKTRHGTPASLRHQRTCDSRPQKVRKEQKYARKTSLKAAPSALRNDAAIHLEEAVKQVVNARFMWSSDFEVFSKHDCSASGGEEK